MDFIFVYAVLWAFKTDLNPGKSAFKTGFVTCILKVEN
jgi:hypothetical protein